VKRPRIAYVCCQPVVPADSGARIRNHALLSGLTRHAELEVFFQTSDPSGLCDHVVVAGQRLAACGVVQPPAGRPDVYVGPPDPHPAWRGGFPGSPSDPFLVAMQRRARARPFDLAVVEQVFLYDASRALNAPIVLDEHNIESAIWQDNMTRLGYSSAQREAAVAALRDVERAAWADATLVTCCTAADAAVVRGARAGRPTEVIPNGVALDAIEFTPPSQRRNHRILFIASFFWEPNLAAARVLVLQVLPRVRRYWPDAEVVLCGHDPQGSARALAGPSVRVTGQVRDVAPYLADAAVYCNALASGGGSSLKTVESLASGIPLVATPVGTRGFDVAGLYLPADGPAEMAEAISAVFAQPARFDAQAVVARDACVTYDWARIGTRFAMLVAQVARRGDRDHTRALAPGALRGTRAMVLCGPTAHDAEHAAVLSRGLRARGADVEDYPVASAAAPPVVVTAIASWAPTVVLGVGSAGIVPGIAYHTGLPVIEVLDGSSDLPHPRPPPAEPRDCREVHVVLAEPGPDPAQRGDAAAPRRIGLLSARDDAKAAATVERIARMICDFADAAVHDLSFPAPAFAIAEPDFVVYLQRQSSGQSEEVVRRLLAQGKQLGMPHWPTERGVVYDRARSTQWIWDHSPRHAEHDRRARRALRQRGGYGPDQRGSARCGEPCSGRIVTRPIRYRVHSAIELGPAAQAGGRLRTFLPYPIETDAQRDVRLVSARPAGLEASLIPDTGYFHGFEFSPGDLVEARLEFVCEVTVSEIHTHGRPTRLPSLPAGLTAAEVIAALRAHDAGAYERAWLLHDWMCRVGRHSKIVPACVCPDCAATAFDNHRAGDSRVFAHAFQRFCADLGLRARPVTGAPLSFSRHGVGPRYGHDGLGERPVSLVWTELEIPDLGSIPVDFPAPNRTTWRNCYDAELRSAAERDDRFDREFSFGHLDNQRIRYAPDSAAMPYLLRHDADQPPGDRWQPVPDHHLRFMDEVIELT